MIFVTAGTHEQPFNRLIESIDKLKEKAVISEDVVIQTGYSTYIPKHCGWSRLFAYSQMIDYVKNARIVITHGGPSSFIMPLQMGKIPIVVPRRKKFHEHVNDHQMDFAKAVAERYGSIMIVDGIEELENYILHYEDITAAMPACMKSNNAEFNKGLEMLANEIFRDGSYEKI